ncbi:TonB-dependent receptor [Sphingomonas changnyeongensis]|uniref:TonB-dependent receptor n=1 Tax=Sphingomonas changnyeongensis TaxID=2698679 RepID=A0A7Z2NW31_9SPHN|nr:TonB-dependent receptor [Sphingomonas changnyeongensis]QHL90304.1 TonB-dependent receptor [Sphingomonas changnyeongensis]
MITVTGSRIRRSTAFDTLEPALVISAEYLDSRALTNVADALNELPGFGVGVTPEGGQSGFGVGQNFVNRFGLGSARTLTVVNGRRFVSSNAPTIFGPAAAGLQVDLNVIPSIMVDRIDNLSIGGAPTYGSDAIAGTVNIILREKFQGFEVRALGGITQRGDAERYSFQALAGFNFGADDRGNFMISGSYDKANGLISTERRRFAQGLTARPNPLASSVAAGRTPGNDGRLFNTPFNTGNNDNIPNSVYIRDDRFSVFTGGGLLFPATGAFNLATGAPRGFGAAGTTNLAFNSQGRLFDFNPGTPFGNNNASGGDGFNLNETLPLLSPLERYTATAQLHYEVADNIRFFSEGTFYRADSLELVDQPIYQSNLFGGLSGPLTFSANDPRLHPDDRARLAALGVTDFRLTRASRDIVENNARGRNQLYRIVGGFDGSFEIGGRKFYWEASANYGRSTGTYTQTVLDQQRFSNAINVTTNAQGQIVCNPTPTRNVAPGGVAPIADAACVPLNVFGEGIPSQAALDYVTTRTRTRAVLEQQVYNINVSGSPFSLWAGDVSVVAGFEHRVESGAFRPDAFQIAGRGRAVAILGNQGSFSTREVFGEVLVPLISPQNDIKFFHRLEFEGKIRYVDNTVNGGFTAYTLGGRWEPVRDMQIRGNFTRSLRAPAITELFTPISNIFTAVPDPCDSRNVNGGARPDVRRANCAAFYRQFNLNPASFQSSANDATIPGISGGDPNLDNERSNSWTVGVVLQPRGVPGLRLAADWQQITIRGPIANLTAAQIASGCFDNTNFDTTDVTRANSFCERITRLPNGQIVSDPQTPGIRTGFVNGERIDFRGATAEIGYNFSIDKVGQFDINATLFHLDRLDFNINGIVPDPSVAELGNSRWQGQLNLGYTRGRFGWDIQANFVSAAAINILDVFETRDRIRFDEQILWNTTLSYKLRENSVIRLTVTNLFDIDPPYPLAGAAIGAYDTLGRRAALQLIHKF